MKNLLKKWVLNFVLGFVPSFAQFVVQLELAHWLTFPGCPSNWKARGRGLGLQGGRFSRWRVALVQAPEPEDPKGRRVEFVGISESEEYEIWSVLSL